jgi:mono/diheme cytochrome c family protein
MSKILTAIGALAIAVAIAAPVYLFGGFLNVAANDPHLGIVTWSLEKIRMASISRHAVEQPPVSLDDPAAVLAGARAFSERGCVSCHGAPGGTWAKFSEGMTPSPPDLAEIAKERTPAEIFWVVKHGLKFTGMPSFAAIDVKDDEIWKIVAFVKKLPGVSDADFKAWTAQ